MPKTRDRKPLKEERTIPRIWYAVLSGSGGRPESTALRSPGRRGGGPESTFCCQVQVVPFTENDVGEVSLVVQVPWKPSVVEPPAAMSAL
jgi:hypothetical protein